MALSPMLSTLYVLCSSGVFMKLELYDAQWNSDKFSELEFRNRIASWPLKQIMAKISAEIKRATESAEGCVKDFIFGSKRQPEREIEKLALDSAKEYH
ncbi:unnamed protein product [Prunus armeniaca]